MKGLNPSTALGPDELHPKVLKELAVELGPVFAHLFQQSLDKGEIPKLWFLLTSVHFIRRATELYHVTIVQCPRHVSCVSCKMLEHIVCTNIMAHLDEYKLLSDRQRAFRKNRSCDIQLITVVNDWAKIWDAGGQVDTFILDFEKAFATSPHASRKHAYIILTPLNPTFI